LDAKTEWSRAGLTRAPFSLIKKTSPHVFLVTTDTQHPIDVGDLEYLGDVGRQPAQGKSTTHSNGIGGLFTLAGRVWKTPHENRSQHEGEDEKHRS
jgi:hypothetical protein